MKQNNGQNTINAPFAVFGDQFIVQAAGGVIEMLEKNGISIAKTNLTLSAFFRKVADDFRNWAKQAEPGCVFQASEISLHIVRLSAFAPLASSMSDAVQEHTEALEDEPPPSDRPLIFRE